MLNLIWLLFTAVIWLLGYPYIAVGMAWIILALTLSDGGSGSMFLLILPGIILIYMGAS